MQWLYISDQNEQKVTSETGLPELVNRGAIRADTLVWNNQLSDWKNASEALPGLFPVAPPVTASANPQPAAPIIRSEPAEQRYRELGKLLAQASGWLQFLGVIYALSFIWIVPIFLAVKCFAVSSNAKAAARSGQFAHLRKAIKEVKDLFVLQGAMILITVVLYFVILMFSLADL